MPHGAIGDMGKWVVLLAKFSRKINFGVNIAGNISERNIAGDGNHVLNK